VYKRQIIIIVTIISIICWPSRKIVSQETDENKKGEGAKLAARKLFYRKVGNVKLLNADEVTDTILSISSKGRIWMPVVSPNNKYAGVLYCKDSSDGKNMIFSFYDLTNISNVKTPAFVDSLQDKIFTIKTFLWAPDSKLIYFEIGCKDTEYSEFLRYQIDIDSFIAQDRFEYLKNLKPKQRPEAMHKVGTHASLPVWSVDGKYYSSGWNAERSGVKVFWKKPDWRPRSMLLGFRNPQTRFDIFEIYVRSIGSLQAYIVYNKQIIDIINLAAVWMPYKKNLFYYENKNLTLIKKNSKKSKLNFGSCILNYLCNAGKNGLVMSISSKEHHKIIRIPVVLNTK